MKKSSDTINSCPILIQDPIPESQLTGWIEPYRDILLETSGYDELIIATRFITNYSSAARTRQDPKQMVDSVISFLQGDGRLIDVCREYQISDEMLRNNAARVIKALHLLYPDLFDDVPYVGFSDSSQSRSLKNLNDARIKSIYHSFRSIEKVVKDMRFEVLGIREFFTLLSRGYRVWEIAQRCDLDRYGYTKPAASALSIGLVRRIVYGDKSMDISLTLNKFLGLHAIIQWIEFGKRGYIRSTAETDPERLWSDFVTWVENLDMKSVPKGRFPPSRLYRIKGYVAMLNQFSTDIEAQLDKFLNGPYFRGRNQIWAVPKGVAVLLTLFMRTKKAEELKESLNGAIPPYSLSALRSLKKGIMELVVAYLTTSQKITTTEGKLEVILFRRKMIRDYIDLVAQRVMQQTK